MSFNFKDFILEENSEIENEETPIKKPKKTEVEYKVEWCDGPDFIISRKTKKTEKYMAVIVTKGQYYIKSGEKIEPITLKSYQSFMKDTEGIEVNANWINTLEKGSKFADAIIHCFATEGFQELAKHNLYQFISPTSVNHTYRYADDNCYYTNAFLYYQNNKENFNIILKMIKLIKTKGLMNDNDIKNTLATYGTTFNKKLDTRTHMFFLKKSLDLLVYYYGESGVFELFSECVDNLVPTYRSYYSYYGNDSASSSYDSLGNILFEKCSLQKFKEYMIYESMRQGYEFNEFLRIWSDTLEMQKQIYGKIKDKYPENLESLHKKLSYEVKILNYVEYLKEQEKKDEAISARFEALKEYTYSNNKYVILVPKTVQDILDEASQQHNCLASYVDSFINGTTDIFFMRRKTDEEKSLVTIEIRGGKLRQAYGGRNKKPSAEEMEFISGWCERFGFEYQKDYIPRVA